MVPWVRVHPPLLIRSAYCMPAGHLPVWRLRVHLHDQRAGGRPHEPCAHSERHAGWWRCHGRSLHTAVMEKGVGAR
eukprot:1074319-Pelagomonas_calceolata.AAC.7